VAGEEAGEGEEKEREWAGGGDIRAPPLGGLSLAMGFGARVI